MSKILVIKKRKDFLRVAKGLSVPVPGLILQAAPSLSKDPTPLKVGYTTTKKIGKAHVRNRARRRLRAVANEILSKIGRNNVEYVLIGRYNTATIEFDKLKQSLSNAVSQINKLIKDEVRNAKKSNLKPTDSAD